MNIWWILKELTTIECLEKFVIMNTLRFGILNTSRIYEEVYYLLCRLHEHKRKTSTFYKVIISSAKRFTYLPTSDSFRVVCFYQSCCVLPVQYFILWYVYYKRQCPRTIYWIVSTVEILLYNFEITAV